ncbi:DUF6497 family protein [Sulfitobacter sp. JB4-11]|uniref:DUF6497 family protein n=1 Tax=Sulfitobacter rhodophyticola TaxID=3238304 RepID=UPI003515BDFA
MKLLLAVLALVAAPALAVDVPSGQAVTLHEVLIDEVGTEAWVRFRFVTPGIAREGGTVDYDTAAQDMDHLCESLAIPYIGEFALMADVIVISLADRITEFGVADPDATQFIEAYRAEGDTCSWEPL